jgi:membrane protease YdiL (CAAX protease family)
LESVEGFKTEVKSIKCTTCGYEGVNHRFCTHCGTIQQEVAEAIPEQTFHSHAKILITFYLVYLLTCLVVENTDAFKEYNNLVWIEVFLAVWTLIFAYANWSEIRPLYSLKNVRIPQLLLCAGGGVIFSLIVGAGSTWLNLELFGKRLNYYGIYEHLEYSVPVFIFSLAIYPAIFEELGFRGVVYNYVDSVAGANNAIYISSMAFAIMHVSLISLVWLVPFALVAGYLRYHYKTLWYGMTLHLFFNGTVCVSELLKGGIF